MTSSMQSSTQPYWKKRQITEYYLSLLQTNHPVLFEYGGSPFIQPFLFVVLHIGSVYLDMVCSIIGLCVEPGVRQGPYWAMNISVRSCLLSPRIDVGTDSKWLIVNGLWKMCPQY